MRCSQCNEDYPEDQLITLKDHLVCALCKPIFLQKSEEGAVELLEEFELASRGRRLGSAVLDIVIYWAFFLPGYAIIIYGLFADLGDENGGLNPDKLSNRMENFDISSDFGQKLILGSCLMMVGVFVYCVLNIIFLHKNGQTISKKILGIKILYKDNTRIGFWGVFLKRNLLFYVVALIPILGVFIYYILGLVDVLLIFRENKSCLHDSVANTKVVKIIKE